MVLRIGLEPMTWRVEAARSNPTELPEHVLFAKSNIK